MIHPGCTIRWRMQFSIVNLNLHPHEAIFIHSKIMATTITEPEVFFCNLDLLLDNSGIDAYIITWKRNMKMLILIYKLNDKH